MTTHRTASLRRWLRACHQPRAEGWADAWWALGLGIVYLVLLSATASSVGYARDEGFYFQAARSYQHWFELLVASPGTALASVDRYWSVNHEHPALTKSLFALSHWVLWDKLQLTGVEGLSYRLPAMALSALGVGLTYLWGARSSGRLAGLVAAGSLGAMPRFFFHAHLACFDAPIAALWLLCAYCYWRALGRGGWWWPIATGMSFGLALDTKHNAWFLPIVCGLHALLLVTSGARRPDERRIMRRRALAALVAMAVLGPLLMWAGWPWIWHDTVARLRAYADFHLHHVYYNMELFGHNYWEPPMPRSYAWVMTAATVPVVTLVACVVGLWARLRRDIGAWWQWMARRLSAARQRDEVRRSVRRRSTPLGTRPGAAPVRLDPATAWLWLLAIIVQYAAWLSPQTPIFGGTKHWLAVYPFMVLFAAAAVRMVALAGHLRWRRGPIGRLAATAWLEIGLLVAMLAAPVLEAGHAHPWGLTSYTPWVGGASGAASLGLNRGFWGYTTAAVLPYLNRTAPPGARVYLHDTAASAWDMLRRDGRARRDLVAVPTVAQADIAIYHHELHMRGQEQQAWVAFGTVAPAYVAGLDGVPVIWVYRRRKPVVP